MVVEVVPVLELVFFMAGMLLLPLSPPLSALPSYSAFSWTISRPIKIPRQPRLTGCFYGFCFST